MCDPLTGALNRAALNSRLPAEVQRAARSRKPLALLMLDLDYFKSINDAFGHKRGDEALCGVVERIRSQLRQSDEVFRYGGDEFVVLLSNTVQPEAAEVAQRILQAISSCPLPGKPSISLSASIGLACVPQEAQTLEKLFELADQRHYAAKQSGRGRVVSEDTLHSATKEPWQIDRLLGRDQAIKTLGHFFDALDEQPSAALGVFGARGSGRSRILKEAHRMSRLRGYAVFFLQGSVGLRYHLFGAVNQTLSGWLQHTRFISTEILSQFFHELIERKNLRGLILILDNWRLLDDGTLDLARHFLQKPPGQRVGLIFSAESEAGSPTENFDPGASFSINLQPLRQSEVRAWLRHGLGAEPSSEVLTWFFERSSGLPGKIASALHFLALPEHQSLPWFQVRARLDARLDNALPSSNLPSDLSLFVGRESEIQGIRQALRSPRPVSILGLGGIGKTRLALQVALESQEEFPDGVFFVPISPLTLPEALYQAIGQALGLQVTAGKDGQEALLQALSGKRLLLLLDNFETLPDAAHLLLPLLQELPGLRVLITSRVKIGFEEEQVFALQGLPVPDASSEEVSHFASAQLFLQQARRVFAFYQPEWVEIGEICRLVDGLPLALELAASWVSTFSEAEIAAQIRASVEFLAAQAAAETDAHRSVQAVFQSLWEMFSPQEQSLLAGLGIFQGRFTRFNAREVLGISPFFIDALTAKTILRRSDENYYRIQPVLWQFFRQKLEADPLLRDSLQQKHAAYFFNALEEKAQLFDDPTLGGEALRLTDGQVQNIRAAWDYALQSKREDYLGHCLGPYCAFLRAQGWYVEGIHLLQRVLPALAALRSDSYFPAVILLGEFFFHAGYYLESIALLEQILPSLPRERLLGQAIHRLALTYNAVGRDVESVQLQHQGMQLARELGDLTLQYEFTNRAAISAYLRQDYVTARQLGLQALTLARSLQSTSRMAQTFNNLANFCYEMGDFTQAEEYIQRSLPIAGQVNAQALTVSIYDSAAKIYTAQGNFPRARGLFLQALELLRSMKAWPLAAEVLIGVAELWQAEGKLQEARLIAQKVGDWGYVPRLVLLRAEKISGQPARRLSGSGVGKDGNPELLQGWILEAQQTLQAETG